MSAELPRAVGGLRDALAGVALPLHLPDTAHARSERAELLDQLDDYVLPRLQQLDAPLLTVVGGSTGAGKSTLVNSLVGVRVSEPGVLRPTTRAPVLVHHPDDVGWFDRSRVFPDMPRVTGAAGAPGSLQLVAHPTVPVGLALLDAPDIDSVEADNRTLAGQLLAAADLWLFVTTAARYADQVPWEFLRRAADRSAAVAVVLDRTDPDALDQVRHDLGRMLAERGLGGSRLFAVTESEVDADGLLPPDGVEPVLSWLRELAADADARAAVVRQTLDGALASVVARAGEVADGLDAQVAVADRLREDAETAYAEAVRAVDAACADGSLLRGEVLNRWQEFVGAGKVLRALETRAGWVRDRVGAALTGRPTQAHRVRAAVESGLETLVVEHAEAAAERAESAWRANPAGRELLTRGGRDLGRASRGLRERTERAVRDWQQAVLEMVRTEGADRRSTARFLAFGVNGLGVALMIVVFAHTGGLLAGAEVGVAGGSAVVGQKLLEAVFGDQAVRRLADLARADLEMRVRDLMTEERARFLALLDDVQPDPGAGGRLREAAATVQRLHAGGAA